MLKSIVYEIGLIFLYTFPVAFLIKLFLRVFFQKTVPFPKVYWDAFFATAGITFINLWFDFFIADFLYPEAVLLYHIVSVHLFVPWYLGEALEDADGTKIGFWRSSAAYLSTLLIFVAIGFIAGGAGVTFY